MFWFLYFLIAAVIFICLSVRAIGKNMPWGIQLYIGSLGVSVLWPFFGLAHLLVYSMIFLDKLEK